MTATEELRRLLDERGERYWDMGTSGIWFGIDGDNHVAEVYEQTDHLLGLEMFDLTPERAIDATLGQGTCHETIIDHYWRGCCSCGYIWEFMYGIGKCERPRYCPNCGARVTEN